MGGNRGFKTIEVQKRLSTHSFVFQKRYRTLSELQQGFIGGSLDIAVKEPRQQVTD